MSRRKTNDEFLIELKAINDRIIPQEEYVDNQTKLVCLCKKCGNSWSARPNTLLRGYGCPYCAGTVRKNDKTFREELLKINPNIEPLEPYQNNKKPILCKCKQCGHEWRAMPNNLLSKGHHCPQCSHKQRGEKRRSTNEDFVESLKQLNPNIVPLDPYITNSQKIRCLCTICGHTWSVRPNSLLSKRTRCPNCCKASTSIVEQVLLRSFSSLLGESVLSRDKKAIGMELDIYIPQLHLAIEYGAWYWHKNRIKKDNEKQHLCEEKGIHLITILEDCHTVPSIDLIGDFRLYQERINDETDYHTLKQIINEICLEYHLPFVEIERNWDKIVADSIAFARKRSNEDFLDMMSKKNPSVIVCEAYTKSHNKLLCKCSVCGHKWKVVPSSLLAGRGCPKCARRITGDKKTYTNDEFLLRLSQVNPDVEPLELYTKGNKPIRCKCKLCGNVWFVKPHNLLQNQGCPKCSRERVTKQQSKPIRCIETGVCYDSIADVARKTGIFNAHKCAKGYQKTAGGYHWEYVEDN